MLKLHYLQIIYGSLCYKILLHLRFAIGFYCICYRMHSKLIALGKCNQNRMHFWKIATKDGCFYGCVVCRIYYNEVRVKP